MWPLQQKRLQQMLALELLEQRWLRIIIMMMMIFSSEFLVGHHDHITVIKVISLIRMTWSLGESVISMMIMTVKCGQHDIAKSIWLCFHHSLSNTTINIIGKIIDILLIMTPWEVSSMILFCRGHCFHIFSCFLSLLGEPAISPSSSYSLYSSSSYSSPSSSS